MAELSSAWVVKVGRVKALAGLAWVPLTATDASGVRKEAKDRARDLGARYAAIMQFDGTEYPLAGILAVPPSRFGLHPFGMATAAGWFAASCERPTIYVEKLASGQFWVLGASRFDFDARTDVALSAGKANELICDVYEGWAMQGASPVIITPNFADIEPLNLPYQARIATLASLLSGAPPKSVACKKIVGAPAWVPVACFAVVGAGVAGVAGVRISEKLEQARAQAAAAAQAAQQQADAGIAASQARMRIAGAAQAALDARLVGVSPAAAIQACIQSIDALPETLGGWTMDQAVCEAGQIKATFRASPALMPTESSFRLAAQEAGLSASVQWFETQGSVELALPAAEPRASVLLAALPPKARAGEDMASFYARLSRAVPGVQGTFEQPKPVELAPVDGTQLQPSFAEGKFVVTGGGTWQLAGAIPNRDYLRVERVTVTSRYGAWTVAGTFLTKIES